MRRKPVDRQALDELLMRTDLDVAPMPSPCIGVCRIDKRDSLCSGCLRTLDEIAEWSIFDEARKRAVWQAIRQRHAARPARKSWFSSIF